MPAARHSNRNKFRELAPIRTLLLPHAGALGRRGPDYVAPLLGRHPELALLHAGAAADALLVLNQPEPGGPRLPRRRPTHPTGRQVPAG